MKIFLFFLTCHFFISAANNTCFHSNKSQGHFFCPKNYKDVGGFQVSITPTHQVIIQCQDLNSLDTRQLPPTPESKIASLHFRFCPLPENGFQSFQTWFSRENLSLIEYQFGNPHNQTFVKQTLQDLPGLQFLKLDNNKFADLEADVFGNTPNLIGLFLKQNHLSTIHPKLFEALQNLKWLDLSDNLLEALPSGLFKPLKKLKHLNLARNRIAKLTNSVFEGLSSMESLQLGSNKIKTISNRTFGHMRALANLSLAMNDLRAISSSHFVNSSNLEVVVLNDNSNLKVKDNAFSNLTALQEVDLSNCGLKDVSGGIFAYSHKLRVVQLQNNALKTLPEKIFRNLINLEKIDLSGNDLDDIDGILASLKKLLVLSLENNAITTIKKTTFSDLILLEELNLAQNEISNIDEDTFSNNYRLREINLSRNSYRGDGNIFKNLVYLQSLYLSHNLITDIEELITFDNKPVMGVLDLRRNSISSLSLRSLQSLSEVEVNLEFNNISIVSFEDTDFSQSYYTVTIHLGHNPLKCDCRNYDLLKYFKDESDEELVTMFNIRKESMTCVKNNSIDDLELSSVACDFEDLNEDSECPKECLCSWRPFGSSIVVDCSNRNLTYVPKISTRSFQWLNFSQVEVNLDNNSLIAVNLSQVVNITALSLSHNKLVDVQGVPDRYLKVLHLDDNRLTTLRPGFLRIVNTSSLVTLTLNNNPWICNCDSENLRLFVQNHLNLMDFRRVYCYNSSVRLIDLQEGYLCREMDMIYASFAVCLSLAVAVSSIFTFLFIICVRRDILALMANYVRVPTMRENEKMKNIKL